MKIKLLDRIFETATRPFELFNALNFLAYAYVFLADGETLYHNYIYAQFQNVPIGLMVGVFAVLGLAQLGFALRDNPNSNIISGYISLLCGGVWFWVWVAFAAPYPPLNTGIVHSFLMWAACLLCGKRLIDQNKLWKHLLDKNKGA